MKKNNTFSTKNLEMTRGFFELYRLKFNALNRFPLFQTVSRMMRIATSLTLLIVRIGFFFQTVSRMMRIATFIRIYYIYYK